MSDPIERVGGDKDRSGVTHSYKDSITKGNVLKARAGNAFHPVCSVLRGEDAFLEINDDEVFQAISYCRGAWTVHRKRHVCKIREVSCRADRAAEKIIIYNAYVYSVSVNEIKQPSAGYLPLSPVQPI